MSDYFSIRSELKAGQWMGNPFRVLSEIAQICRTTQELGRELVIRVLEKKSELDAPYQAIAEELACAVGLLPYVDRLDELTLRNAISHASHRADGIMGEYILHSAQARVLRKLISGESVILSAPTSFGKSLLIDLTISAKDFKNIVLIVPTLALVEETRRRMARFSERYSIITSNDQALGEENIFVLTQERYLAMASEMPAIDFFAVDEFYKLSISKEPDRATLLNQAFLRLVQTGAQFYLLGPSVKAIPEFAQERLNCSFMVEDFQTVAIELHQVKKLPSQEEAFANLVDKLSGPTLVYCKSPNSTRALLKDYLHLRDIPISDDIELVEAAEWTAANYHQDWLVSVGLKHGIGIHHGRLPKSLARFMVRAFEEKKIKLLLCTSTLIEGVNTVAQNVIVYDNVLNQKKLDFFTFNNIRGRSGRMFKHFVGNVYLFAPPPQEDLPFVDIPAIAPNEHTPSSLLIHMDSVELPPLAQAKVDLLVSQQVLPLELMRKLSSIEPEFLIDTTKYLFSLDVRQLRAFCWSSRPQYEDIKITSEVIWEQLGGKTAAKKSAVLSAAMMTKWLWDLYKSQSVRKFRIDAIKSQIAFGRSPDVAVEEVLAFLRGWASFNYPVYLSALGELVTFVLSKKGFGSNNYVPFAATIEKLFQPNSFSTLEEYGLPTEISERLLNSRLFEKDDRLDTVVDRLRARDITKFASNTFEKRVIEDFQEGIGKKPR